MYETSFCCGERVKRSALISHEIKSRSNNIHGLARSKGRNTDGIVVLDDL